MLEPPASDGLVLVAQPLTGQPFRVTDTGLVVTGAPSFEEWEHVGERLAALERGLQWAIGDWLNYGSRKYARGRYETLAASFGLEKETVRKYAQVAAAYESGIRIPSLTFLHHQIAAALPAQQQQALLLEAGRRGWSASRLKRAIRDLSTVAPAAFPAGKYRVIYADPPWCYRNSGFDQSADSHYPTLTLDQICDLEQEGRRVRDLATGDTVLFLWVTSPLAPAAFQVIEAWGATYKAMLVWHKDRSPNIGWFVRTEHELLLIATYEANTHPKMQPQSAIHAPVGAHSAKPDIVYELIEEMYDGPYVELFARSERVGWHSWGNQLEGCADVDESTLQSVLQREREEAAALDEAP